MTGGMHITIHQPEHFPWLGFFDKARQVERFVLMDNVQFRKRYFQNRNRILSPNGPIWLTVPVLVRGKQDQLISEVRIDNAGSPRWREKHWKSIVSCYDKAPFFLEHAHFFGQLYRTVWERLVDLNRAVIEYLFQAFGINVDVVMASGLEATGKRGDLVYEICVRAGAKSHLSGISGREFLDVDKFSRAGIEIRFQEFYHPIYRQLYEPFVPCMSAIDLLFNHGPKSRDILSGIGVERLDSVFE